MGVAFSTDSFEEWIVNDCPKKICVLGCDNLSPFKNFCLSPWTFIRNIENCSCDAKVKFLVIKYSRQKNVIGNE